jgi:MAC/Perforin domain
MALTPEEWATLQSFGGSGEASVPSQRQPIPGLEFLGMGYDVFDRYASVESCKQHILDFSAEPEVDQQVIDASIQLEIIRTAFNTVPMEIKLIYKRPQRVLFLPRYEVKSDYEFDSTIDDQITKWSNHTNLSGGFGPFSAEIDARFGSTLAKLATTKFYSLVAKSTYWQLSLNYSIGQPAPVRADVQPDLDNPSLAPADFFEQYGTHYLSSISVGCRVTVSCAIETSQVDSDFDFSSYLNVTYGGKRGSAGAANDTTYQNKVKRFQEHSRTSVFGVGISDEQLDKIGQGAEAGVAVLKGGWHTPSLIDFSKGSLKRIWMLAKDGARQSAFQAEFDRRAAQRTSIISSLSLYIPIYLYRSNDVCGYRLYPTANLEGSSDAGGVAWKIQNGGKPLFNIAAKQIEGTIPLYQYRLQSDPCVWRFEAGPVWYEWLGEGVNRNRDWQRVSSKPVGYVLETNQCWGKPIAAGVCPVYAYITPRGQPARFYYSVDEDDRGYPPGEAWGRFNYWMDTLNRGNDRPGGGGISPEQLTRYHEYFGALERRQSSPGWPQRDGGPNRPQWYAWSPL